MSTIKLKKTPCIIALVIIGFFLAIQSLLYPNKWVALAYLCVFLYTIYFIKRYSLKNKMEIHNKREKNPKNRLRDKIGPKVDLTKEFKLQNHRQDT